MILLAISWRSFDNIIEDNQFDPAYRFNPLFVGDIFVHNTNLIYIPNYMNHILCYSNNGSLKYSIKTIDDIKKPVLEMKSVNGGYAVSASFRHNKCHLFMPKYLRITYLF